MPRNDTFTLKSTSSHLVPSIGQNLSVKIDLVPTSSRAISSFGFDLVPPRPEIHAQFDLVPTSSRERDELKSKFAHDFVPPSPVSRQGGGRGGDGLDDE